MLFLLENQAPILQQNNLQLSRLTKLRRKNLLRMQLPRLTNVACQQKNLQPIFPTKLAR